MKQDPRRDPVRRLRARVDRREPRRPGELQAHARRAGRHAGRARRQGAALAHGLDQARVLGGAARDARLRLLAPPRRRRARGRLRAGARALPPLARARPARRLRGSAGAARGRAAVAGAGAGPAPSTAPAMRTGTCVEDCAALGVLDEAAVARGHRDRARRVARASAGAGGSIYRLLEGTRALGERARRRVGRARAGGASARAGRAARRRHGPERAGLWRRRSGSAPSRARPRSAGALGCRALDRWPSRVGRARSLAAVATGARGGANHREATSSTAARLGTRSLEPLDPTQPHDAERHTLDDPRGAQARRRPLRLRPVEGPPRAARAPRRRGRRA